MKKRMLAAVLCLFVLAVVVAGCTIVFEERRANLSTVKVLPQKELLIQTENGYVNIKPAIGPDIVIDGEKTVRGDNVLIMESYLETLGITVTESDGKVEVKIKRNTTLPAGVVSVSVNLTIQIPVDVVNKVSVITSNGPVTVDGVNGELNIATSNGEIDVTNVTGDMNLYTSNGKITGKEIAGDLDADASNGAINIETTRKLDGATLETSNAGIYYEADIQDHSTYDFYTSNGSIELYVQPEPFITLEAITSNGSIMCDFPVDPEPTEQYPDEIVGEINGGGAIVDLRTSNGDIIITERW